MERLTFRWPLPAVLAVGLLSSILCFDASASRLSPDPLNPKSYDSPSKEYCLHVNPSQRQGGGPGEYALSKNGHTLWSKTLPFTFYGAVVFDDGTTAGYAYTQGPEGCGGKTFGDCGKLIVAILDPKGNVRQKDEYVRDYGQSRFEDQYPQPEINALVADPENDRLIVIHADPDINKQNSTWQVYRVSTGEKLKPFRPKDWFEDPKDLHWCFAPRPLPGTSLVLVQWYRSEWKPYLKGTHFALLDLQNGPVWQETLRDDYTIDDNEKAEDRLWNWIRGNSAILSVGPKGRFDLYYAKDEERVSWAAEKDKHGKWTVVENDRKLFELPPPSAEDEVASWEKAAEAFPEHSLDYLGVIRLGGEKNKQAKRPENKDIGEFVVDGEGRFVLVREYEKGKWELARMDPKGTVTDRLALPPLASEQMRWIKPTILSDGRYVVILSHFGRDHKSKAYFADFGKKKLTPVQDFDCPDVAATAGIPEGGFAVLMRHWSKYTIAEELRGYGADGKLKWFVLQDNQDHEKLFSPEDICVTPKGLVAVVDNIRDDVTFYNSTSGDFAGKIDLKKTWGRDPRYPCEIFALPDGDLIIGDAVASNGSFVRMTGKGKIVKEFRLRLANGQEAPQNLCVGLNGRLWTSLGAAFMELDNQGAAKRVVGKLPSSEQLNEIAAATTDREGKIYVLDRKTYCTHVFDQQGNRLMVCKPKPTDAAADSYDFPNITISDAGEILVSRLEGSPGGGKTSYIRYSAEGKRLGIAPSTGLDSITEEWLFQPGTGRRWIRGYEDVFLVDSKNKVIHKIERRPSGDWLRRPDGMAVSPDGSLVVLDGAINRYSAKGKPLGSVPSPVAYGNAAYNGKWIAAIDYSGPLYLLDASGKPILKFDPGKRLTPNRHRFLFFTHNGEELWILDGPTQTIHRFAFPKPDRAKQIS